MQVACREHAGANVEHLGMQPCISRQALRSPLDSGTPAHSSHCSQQVCALQHMANSALCSWSCLCSFFTRSGHEAELAVCEQVWQCGATGKEPLSCLQAKQPHLQRRRSPNRTVERDQSADVSGMHKVTPDLLVGLRASKATPQLWPAPADVAAQPRLPLSVRSPNTATGRPMATREVQSNSWNTAGMCPGAFDTAECSHPLFTMSREQTQGKSPVPTPVKDTVRKNLFGA